MNKYSGDRSVFNHSCQLSHTVIFPSFPLPIPIPTPTASPKSGVCRGRGESQLRFDQMCRVYRKTREMTLLCISWVQYLLGNKWSMNSFFFKCQSHAVLKSANITLPGAICQMHCAWFYEKWAIRHPFVLIEWVVWSLVIWVKNLLDMLVTILGDRNCK